MLLNARRILVLEELGYLLPVAVATIQHAVQQAAFLVLRAIKYAYKKSSTFCKLNNCKYKPYIVINAHNSTLYQKNVDSKDLTVILIVIFLRFLEANFLYETGETFFYFGLKLKITSLRVLVYDKNLLLHQLIKCRVLILFVRLSSHFRS